MILANDDARCAIRALLNKCDDLRNQRDALRDELAAFKAECELLRHQIITCGVAAEHPDPRLTHTGAYINEWNTAQAEAVRRLRIDRDRLLSRQPADDDSLEQYKRMFGAACAALGAINEALGLDPDDGGAEPILAAIDELRADPMPAEGFQARYRLPDGEWSSWGAVICGVKGHEQELRCLPAQPKLAPLIEAQQREIEAHQATISKLRSENYTMTAALIVAECALRDLTDYKYAAGALAMVSAALKEDDDA